MMKILWIKKYKNLDVNMVYEWENVFFLIIIIFLLFFEKYNICNHYFNDYIYYCYVIAVASFLQFRLQSLDARGRMN